MKFTKMQGAANDFVVVDARNLAREWSKLAVAICDRHLGVGADSLLLLVNSTRADFGMRTFDADGSEAETCGNGIRCLARYVLERGLARPDTGEITIETVAAINRVTFEEENGRITRFRANMGRPQLAAERIPVQLEAGRGVDINNMLSHKVSVGDLTLTLNFVSMGNPHAVFFTDRPVAEFPLASIGSVVERLPIFPQRTNFEVVRVLGKGRVEARVWERGVGETLACGSGAGAIAVAAALLGYTGNEVAIQLPGGTLHAERNGSGDVVLAGPAEIVFEGEWPD